jgi:hypothetical protein
LVLHPFAGDFANQPGNARSGNIRFRMAAALTPLMRVRDPAVATKDDGNDRLARN